MLKLARGSSNFSVSSIGHERPLKPRKEAQKRKNVHFEDDLDVVQPQQFTMSTATFLRQKGMAWNSLARTLYALQIRIG
ncbi:hypothetical protein Y032_0850g2685 [Ancylostoma ceylanicum]|uniref:Uncharacterized protein n=1 Tax=Ancylostoma ceylanicum TaxID=53326 RepID=A0A016WAJ0_9BILA|nr:hypothetical protein Y032_0850g2685 [Ancylostoma ceylanicum]